MRVLILNLLAHVLQYAIVAGVVVTPFLWICGGPRLITRVYQGLGRAVARGFFYTARISLLFCINTIALLFRLVGSLGQRERMADACASYVERMGDALVSNTDRR